MTKRLNKNRYRCPSCHKTLDDWDAYKQKCGVCECSISQSLADKVMNGLVADGLIKRTIKKIGDKTITRYNNNRFSVI